ncbi:hypothetical protein BDK89_0651 [Ilumatobacter fluminis]|uniref:CN hydrolase domain-containing protein n=2 Tax=Ilumatobacter fluminis TaxID=467091 RepID=A0A4R7HVT4_9ACTN|nr:hypothetical protein BDK89_0651 [Ilumatobacter fluminis]
MVVGAGGGGGVVVVVVVVVDVVVLVVVDVLVVVLVDVLVVVIVGSVTGNVVVVVMVVGTTVVVVGTTVVVDDVVAVVSIPGDASPPSPAHPATSTHAVTMRPTCHRTVPSLAAEMLHVAARHGRLSPMERKIRVAGGQMGPIQRADEREQVVERLIALLTEAADLGCDLIVFPELTLTTFFPRWHTGKVSDFDHFYETEMPNAATQPLFDEAKRRGIGFSLGYALLEEAADGVVHRWNVQTLVDASGEIVGTFKKVHIPGHDEFDPARPFQHAERYFFEPSPDGFGVWEAFGARVGMMICNDRRWPETYREMGLQGVELILCGYNTPIHYVPDPSQDRLQGFHNKLVMQSGAYQNGTFVVGVAKGGVEEGVASLCESIIVAPSGEILAEAATDGDEVIWADLRLDWCKQYTGTLFDMDYYRRPEVYTRLTTMRGPNG